MKNQGKIYSFELHEHRSALVSDSAKRLGIDIIDCKIKDSTVFDKNYYEIADKVLADVPCSGLGTIAKKPDIRFKKQTELLSLEKTQLEILRNAAKYLKKGATLIYSTCTLNKAENEDIVETFLKKIPNFSL
jgi:16S rRNA (cytosine967-C5)-methyltransferase